MNLYRNIKTGVLCFLYYNSPMMYLGGWYEEECYFTKKIIKIKYKTLISNYKLVSIV